MDRKFVYRIVRNLLILTLVGALLFSFDQVSKVLIFEKFPNMNYGWIGIESLRNYNSTVLSFLGLSLSLWVHHLLNSILLLIFVLLTLFSRNIWSTFAFTFLVAGIAGNAIDRWVLSGGYVRDIIYLPWANGGIFNIADVLIIGGASLGVAITIFSLFQKDPNQVNQKTGIKNAR